MKLLVCEAKATINRWVLPHMTEASKRAWSIAEGLFGSTANLPDAVEFTDAQGLYWRAEKEADDAH